MFAIENLPKALFEKNNSLVLTGILRGVEREALRVTHTGSLSQSPHPIGLGSALTHPQITTDFSESLLEFITPPTHRISDLFEHLTSIQKFVLSQLSHEFLWGASMPCVLGDDSGIPVARYGHSNNGLMKTIYRIGLGHRYGRTMQTVAGIHYNFSLPNAFWALLSREQNRIDDLQDFKNEAYFGLIRNFRRHYWLLIYLFGASPALGKSFVNHKQHRLQTLSDGQTLYLPHATSLRMGDLGYQSAVQEALYVCYNDKTSYINSLCRAITQPHEKYQAIGLKDEKDQYKQLNTSILQIENEFYSAIRPKRTAKPGETALSALENRGVEYIEVRCTDINPLTPLGIDRSQVSFLDTFLMYCALKDSQNTSPEETARILQNQKKVVSFGRQPGLSLEHPEGGSLELREWGLDILESMTTLAQLLDSVNHTDIHARSLKLQIQKLNNPQLTPSATIIDHLQSTGESFQDYTLALSKAHNNALKNEPMTALEKRRMVDMAEESLKEQEAIEACHGESFDDFIQRYYKQYTRCSKT